VTKGANGQFYNYNLFTKQGDLSYGTYHSTRMIADRFVLRARQTPADQPLFAILSIYNLHAPNTPLPKFAGDQRCASMPPWNPPNYNEADMSDKPAFQRSRPLLPHPAGWPMVRYCEEMLGVEWLTERVAGELEAQGRLENTLLVFTADNGIGWGAHRVGQNKVLPFTTPVPLYMSWPARWGNDGRTVSELTSNIDLAPTFCELGGCNLGPFPTGQSKPDGVSLVPRAVDAAGRKSALSPPISVTSTKSVTSPPPATGPSVPQGLTATPGSNFVINLSWQASTSDQAGTIRYRVFRNGNAIGSLQTSLTFVDQRSKVNTFTYRVRAVDAAGHKSALSPPVTVTSRR
jgi:hypothetical protein